MLLYNGKQRWTVNHQFRKLLNNEEMFGPELLDFEYLLIDVARYTEEELLSLSNTIGSVFLLDQTEDQAQLLERLGKLMHTIQQLPEESQQNFIAWMANYLLHKLPENEAHIQEFVQSVKGDVSVRGLEKILNDIERKGIREGEQKAKEEVAKRMIDLGLDASVIAAATGFSPDKIEALREKSH
ncbi:Rpn family recombination-promoting nuclease/putative transposase [Paenibacillus dendritiformis]|uniref:Rpn family recombination-promoting nuclease/putative transposase n=1 Tax=Paenibacillus dendritiformis TaxID=130049 RepID=UPI001F115CFD|nr:Rpn family recombination-promoting nuclease/putative transposase [Paenibacillus dendritiformis]